MKRQEGKHIDLSLQEKELQKVLQTDSQKKSTCLVTQHGQWLQKLALGTGQYQKVKALKNQKWIYRPRRHEHFQDPHKEGKKIKMQKMAKRKVLGPIRHRKAQ